MNRTNDGRVSMYRGDRTRVMPQEQEIVRNIIPCMKIRIFEMAAASVSGTFSGICRMDNLFAHAVNVT